jgi:hypothetical protein
MHIAATFALVVHVALVHGPLVQQDQRTDAAEQYGLADLLATEEEDQNTGT